MSGQITISTPTLLYMAPYRSGKNDKVQKPKKFYRPIFRMSVTCLKATKPLRRNSLFLTNKLPVVPATHFIYLRRIKG